MIERKIADENIRIMDGIFDITHIGVAFPREQFVGVRPLSHKYRSFYCCVFIYIVQDKPDEPLLLIWA